MKEQKNALLLFSKPPIPGLVKTRLTKARGGYFTDEEAADFFHRSLFDVAENCCQALDRLEVANNAEIAENPAAIFQSYDIFISTTPTENVDRMKDIFGEAGTWPREFRYLLDSGATFDDHFDDAFQQIFDQGYATVLSVGGDIPTLPRDHIIQGFNWLHYFQSVNDNGGVVVAPCQECGTSLIGYTVDSGMNHQGVYYASNGRPALDAYIDKTIKLGVHIACLAVVPDVDDLQDLAHTITLMKAIELCADGQDLFVPHRTLAWVHFKELQAVAPPNEDRDTREGLDF
jgi:uncharacterized protein